MAMPAARFASLLPAAVASARFIAAMYSIAAAWSCRASYQRQPCQPATAPTIATARGHDQAAIPLQQLLCAFGA